MIQQILAAMMSQKDDQGWMHCSFTVEGLEIDYGEHGVAIRNNPLPRIQARLTDKSSLYPGAYSFIEVLWNRELESEHNARDHALEGSFYGGYENSFPIARERNGFSGCPVGTETGLVVWLELDPDGVTWWFDHNFNTQGGVTEWEDHVIDVSTGPGTGTGTGTGSGDESGGLVVNLIENAVVIFTGVGAVYFNVPTYFTQDVTFTGDVNFGSTYNLDIVSSVCPQWVIIPPNSFIYSDSEGNWFYVTHEDTPTGYVLTRQADGSIDWDAAPGTGTVTSVDLTAPADGITVSGGPITSSGSITLTLADDLAALEALSTTGFVTRTAANTYAQRFLVQPSSGFTISNSSGIADNPTFALSDDLAALEALTGTDTIYYRSGSSTWTAVTMGLLITFSGGTIAIGGGTVVVAYLASNQSITTDTPTVIQIDTETTDSLGEFNTGSYTFTPSSTGKYLVEFRCTVGGTSTRIIASLFVSGGSEVVRFSDGNDILGGGMAIVDLTASTAYDFQVYVQGSSLAAQGGAAKTFIHIRRHF